MAKKEKSESKRRKGHRNEAQKEMKQAGARERK
jgi:hypothetical protein